MIGLTKRTAKCLGDLLLFSFVFLTLISVTAATDEAGTTFLEGKSAEADVVTLPSGLRYKVLEKGGGYFHPKQDAPCLYHYAGTLIDGSESDSSYARGAPSTVAPDKAIDGLTEAMQLMVEGDKWELYIPSELAYGDLGNPPQIPADAALVYTIELIKIKGTRTPAWKCKVATLEDCDDRMKAFIQKSVTDFGGDPDELEHEIVRLVKTVNSDMDEELLIWINMRVFLLQQMMVGGLTFQSFDGDELADEL